uniref:YqaJ viral recombinase domain-containing protein n=1 Tax=Variovorax paradoxus (strain S110) TaxID=543728 RepID=C5CJK9_VARPS
MRDFKFRCSSIGKLMTEPKTQKEGPLSEGAKTYIRELAAQEIFGVDFEVSSKQMEKGILVEQDSIDLLNRVRGLSLTKNTERRSNDFLTGECDLFDAPGRRGHDVKSPWSIATFPIAVADCEDKLYEWQMRGYMALWNAGEWEVNYCLVDTPEKLIGFEPLAMHVVGHIPEHMRVTSWTITRDPEKEAAMFQKVMHARAYMAEVIAEFDRTHRSAEIEVIA